MRRIARCFASALLALVFIDLIDGISPSSEVEIAYSDTGGTDGGASQVPDAEFLCGRATLAAPIVVARSPARTEPLVPPVRGPVTCGFPPLPDHPPKPVAF